MANVNCYPVNNVIKPDQPVNSQFIQKILDENVGLIHAIIEKQQQNQEAEDLLKSLHKNLIYLATIADQTTSAGNANSGAHSTQQNQYNYPQVTVAHSTIQNQNFPTNINSTSSSSGNMQPINSHQYVTQSGMVTAPIASIDTAEKKPQPVVEDTYNNDYHVKSDSAGPGTFEMEREMEKALRGGRDSNQPIASHKNVDIDKECCTVVSDPPKEGAVVNANSSSSNNSEYVQKYEEPPSTTAAAATAPPPHPHMGNNHPNIKTDMPPPSQPIGSMHQQDSKGPPPMQYPGNQRIMYPAGVPSPNYNPHQYNPHFEQQQQQNNKFYPQNIYPQQSSPYSYQGIYNPYQSVAPPPPSAAAASPAQHYNQHMMSSPLYPQYPGYYPQQQPPPPSLDQLPQGAKDGNLPPQIHPPNNNNNQSYPPNTIPQSMYPPAHPSLPLPAAPPSMTNPSVPMKPNNPQNSTESMPMPAAVAQNPNMSE